MASVNTEVTDLDRENDKENGDISPSEFISPEYLRNYIENCIDIFRKDIFKQLKNNNTDSIIDYLIIINLTPILLAHKSKDPRIKDLMKSILPMNYNIFESYLGEKKLNLNNSLNDNIHKLINNDKFGPTIFENILIYTETLPLMEEKFRDREWVLKNLQEELGRYHQKGLFQRINVVLPSEELDRPVTSRGDLQIKVSASKPNIVAGEEFSVFVVISNPFEVPIIIYSVETQIPVELIDSLGKQLRIASLSEDPSFQRSKEDFWNNILRITWDQWRIKLKMAMEPENRIAQAVAPSELGKRKVDKITDKISVFQDVNSIKEGGKVDGVNVLDKNGLEKIGGEIQIHQNVNAMQDGCRLSGMAVNPIDMVFYGISPQYLDNILWRLNAFKKGSIPIVLQPGDSIVKQFIFETKSWLFFTPLAHTLQIQVRYGVDNRDHLYTIPYLMEIQAAITATMIGSIVGGTVGGVARLLSEMQTNTLTNNAAANFISLFLAVILSAIAIVSFARKSGVQHIISVEDFWGGLFLGFLIGFFGQKFALDLISPSTMILSNSTI